MPIYVYNCRDCGAVEEHIQRFSDPPLTECGSCGGHLSKQITTAAFHLKGGGWYKDGYASAKGDGGGSSDSGGSSSSSSSSSDSGSGASSSGSGSSSSSSDGGSSSKASAAAE